MTDEQTQDQDPEGEGQGDGQQGSQVSAEELQASEDKNVELEKRLADLNRGLKKSQGEAKVHQRRADRLATAIGQTPKKPPPQTQGRVRPQGQQGQQQKQSDAEGEGDTPMEALAEFANDTAKEAALLREVLNRGLSLDDVADLEFESVVELEMRLDSIQQQREIADLRKSIEDREIQSGDEGASGDGASGELQIDAGGQTGGVGDKQVQRADELRKQARDLRAKGKYKEATWLALRASHVDPNKVLSAEVPGEEF